MNKFYQPFQINRIPIYFHWSAVFMFAIFYLAVPIFGTPFLFIPTGIFVMMMVHELGHAYLAIRMGGYVERIELYPILGICYYSYGFYEPYGEYKDAVIAWGGVAAQMLLFIPAALILTLFGNTKFGSLNVLLVMFSYINGSTIIFNLTPGFGLDGTKAWRIIPIFIITKWGNYLLKSKWKRSVKHNASHLKTGYCGWQANK